MSRPRPEDDLLDLGRRIDRDRFRDAYRSLAVSPEANVVKYVGSSRTVGEIRTCGDHRSAEERSLDVVVRWKAAAFTAKSSQRFA
jgi:hypothetical protein